MSIKLNSLSTDDVKLYNTITTPSTIRELFSAIKVSKVDGGAGVKECYDLIFKSKYETALKQFWKDIENICVKENEIITRNIFNNLINSQLESVKIDGKERKCNDIIVKNMLSEGELANPIKQRELRRIMEPFFSPPVKKSNTLNQKNIITKFIGDRENEPHPDLIKQLNRN